MIGTMIQLCSCLCECVQIFNCELSGEGRIYVGGKLLASC